MVKAVASVDGRARILPLFVSGVLTRPQANK